MTTDTLTHANGAAHALPRLAPVPVIGPARSWPRTAIPAPPPGARLLPIVAPDQDPPPPASAVKPACAAWRFPRLRVPAVNADAIITWAMAANVTVVAVDAAIVSYTHIYDLATGQPGSGLEDHTQAHLLPLSIDGIIAEASLVLLYAARHKLPVPRLARIMLWLGITATVAANVTRGLPASILSPHIHDMISALLSAWPAAAFIGSVEMAMGLVRAVQAVADGEPLASRQRTGRWWWRRNRQAAKRATQSAAVADTSKPRSANSASATAESEPPAPPRRQTAAPPASAKDRQPRRGRKTPARQPETAGVKLAAAMALLEETPAMTFSDLMAAGVSEGTATRAKKRQREQAGGQPATP